MKFQLAQSIPIFISFGHFTATPIVNRKTLNMKIKNASHQMKNRIGQSYGMKNAKSLFYLPLKLNFLKRYYFRNIILVNLIIHKIRRLVVDIKTSCIILYNIFLQRVAHILESAQVRLIML